MKKSLGTLILFCLLASCSVHNINYYHTITKNSLRTMLIKEFETTNIFIPDNVYQLVSDKDMIRILSKVKYRQYDKEVMDCDDMSLILHAEIVKNNKSVFPLAVGEIWISVGNTYHSMIIIVSESDILLLEPQNGNVRKPNNEKVFYIRM
jgi:hypothetical protein